MLELSLSHEEWRLLQFVMILSSSYQIWGSAYRLYDRYKTQQEVQKLKNTNKELERLGEQLNNRQPGQGQARLDAALQIRNIQTHQIYEEDQARRTERGEPPVSFEEFQRSREGQMRLQRGRQAGLGGGGNGGADRGDEGHATEGETVRG